MEIGRSGFIISWLRQWLKQSAMHVSCARCRIIMVSVIFAAYEFSDSKLLLQAWWAARDGEKQPEKTGAWKALLFSSFLFLSGFLRAWEGIFLTMPELR